MVIISYAPIIMRQVEHEEDNGVFARVITDRLDVYFRVSAIKL